MSTSASRCRIPKPRPVSTAGFSTQLFKEKDPPPRFYVRIGINYLAFGQKTDTPSFIDHFCALTDGRGEAHNAIEDAGITFSGNGALGMAADPDGLRFQLLGVPGGLAGTIVPGPRISQGEPLFQAIGTDHLILHVSNLEASAAHCKKVFGPSYPARRNSIAFGSNWPIRVWPRTSGRRRKTKYPSVRVAGFDAKGAASKLKAADRGHVFGRQSSHVQGSERNRDGDPGQCVDSTGLFECLYEHIIRKKGSSQ